jgi:asparagine synthase (glutamine-hydrolysing)
MFCPQKIIRKKKHGFGMPFGDWILVDRALRELAFDSMSSLKPRGVVRPAFIEELCGSRLREHANYYGGFIWILMILELWLQWWQRDATPARSSSRQ